MRLNTFLPNFDKIRISILWNL